MRSRSSQAVAKWLREQEWYEAWIDNLTLQEEDQNIIQWFIEGNVGSSTIQCSIVWYQTPEGDDYWREINRQFKEWYYGNEDSSRGERLSQETEVGAQVR